PFPWGLLREAKGLARGLRASPAPIKKHSPYDDSGKCFSRKWETDKNPAAPRRPSADLTGTRRRIFRPRLRRKGITGIGPVQLLVHLIQQPSQFLRLNPLLDPLQGFPDPVHLPLQFVEGAHALLQRLRLPLDVKQLLNQLIRFDPSRYRRGFPEKDVAPANFLEIGHLLCRRPNGTDALLRFQLAQQLVCIRHILRPELFPSPQDLVQFKGGRKRFGVSLQGGGPLPKRPEELPPAGLRLPLLPLPFRFPGHPSEKPWNDDAVDKNRQKRPQQGADGRAGQKVRIHPVGPQCVHRAPAPFHPLGRRFLSVLLFLPSDRMKVLHEKPLCPKTAFRRKKEGSGKEDFSFFEIY